MKDKSIKEVIEMHPIVGEFLNVNGIDCANCIVGTCLLKDFLTIHNYNNDIQKQIYDHIDKLITGESNELVVFDHTKELIPLQPIIEKLINQHKNILQIIYTLEYIISQKDFSKIYQAQLKQLITYVKEYADKEHHMLEEDTLFKDYDNDAVAVMFEEHSMGRSYIKKALANLDNEPILKENLLNYTQLLKNHIYKEDAILFPYLNTINKKNYSFTTNQALEDEVINYLEEFNNNLFTR